MKRKIVLTAVVALALSAAVASLHAEEANAVYNGGFEESYADRVLGWTGAAFKGTAQSVQFFPTDRQKKTGARSYVIANLEPNDSYLIQWVKVRPKTNYLLSAWVFTEGLDSSSVGASVCVYGIQQAPEFVLGAGGQWKKLEFYAQSGPDQTLVPLALRLGFYGSLVKGTAAFDDVSLSRANVIPDGAVLYKFFDDGKISEVLRAKGMVPASVIILIVVLFALALLVLAGYVFRHALLDFSIRVMEGGLALVDRHLLPSQPDGRERRISPRLVYGMPAFVQKGIQGGGNRISEYHCTDISKDGFYLKVDNLDSFQIDDFVNCLFKLGEHRYDVGPAKVVRKQRDLNRAGRLVDSGVGLRFTSTSSADRARVTMLIKALQDATEAEASPWIAKEKTEPKKTRLQRLAEGIARGFKKVVATPSQEVRPLPSTNIEGRLLPPQERRESSTASASLPEAVGDATTSPYATNSQTEITPIVEKKTTTREPAIPAKKTSQKPSTGRVSTTKKADASRNAPPRKTVSTGKTSTLKAPRNAPGKKTAAKTTVKKAPAKKKA